MEEKKKKDLGDIFFAWEERLWTRLARKRVFRSVEQEEALTNITEESIESMDWRFDSSIPTGIE